MNAEKLQPTWKGRTTFKVIIWYCDLVLFSCLTADYQALVMIALSCLLFSFVCLAYSRNTYYGKSNRVFAPVKLMETTQIRIIATGTSPARIP